MNQRTPEFSFHTRNQKITEIFSRSSQAPMLFDAVVIGGGIVGAGLVRELAIRGISCLLVEKKDFASGTSSRSSKLIHGGLRYLEMFDFGLVFESLAERHWLLTSHPHLVQPLEFNLPIYDQKFAPQGARHSVLLGMGLWFYDALSLFRTPFFHGKHSRDEVLKLFPEVLEKGLNGSYYYADAMMLDDELVLEAIYDAFCRGAVPLNYLRACQVSSKDSRGLYTITLEDMFHPGPQAFVQAQEVIVCVGPWAEKIGGCISGGTSKKLKPSRGVHLILKWKRLPVDSCLVMYAPDGRIVFAIPRKDLGSGVETVIVGTTDAPETGDLDSVQAQKTDVDYLLGVLNTYFPHSKFSYADVVITYAGVRPLIDDGQASEAKTSREHEIWRNESDVVFMAGGKYTTFRKISQEIASFAFPDSQPNNAESKAQLSNPNDYKKRLKGNRIWGRYTDEWIRWKLKYHCACTLEDIIFRRSPIWLAGRDLLNGGQGVIDQVAGLTRSHFTWSEEECAQQKKMVEEEVRARCRVLV